MTNILHFTVNGVFNIFYCPAHHNLSLLLFNYSSYKHHSSYHHQLTCKSYLLWQAQLIPYLKGQHLLGFVDESRAPPPPMLSTTSLTLVPLYSLQIRITFNGSSKIFQCLFPQFQRTSRPKLLASPPPCIVQEVL